MSLIKSCFPSFNQILQSFLTPTIIIVIIIAAADAAAAAAADGVIIVIIIVIITATNIVSSNIHSQNLILIYSQ
jgi:hypothetical protein